MPWTVELQPEGVSEPLVLSQFNPPVVTTALDPLSRGGLSLFDLVVRFVSNTNGNFTGKAENLKAAVVRRSDLVTPTAFVTASVGEDLGSRDPAFRLVKLQDFVAGPDNDLVLWVKVVEGDGKRRTVVLRVPLDIRIQNPRAQTLKKLLFKDAFSSNESQEMTRDGALTALNGVSPEVVVGNEWLHFGLITLGTVRIDDPKEADPIPQDVGVSPIPNSPFFAIQNVIGSFDNGTLRALWAVVLRADAEIPPAPMGTPTPVAATFVFNSANRGSFLATNVPGAVRGLDNKAVVWAYFQNDPVPTRAIRRFNGV